MFYLGTDEKNFLLNTLKYILEYVINSISLRSRQTYTLRKSLSGRFPASVHYLSLFAHVPASRGIILIRASTYASNILRFIFEVGMRELTIK